MKIYTKYLLRVSLSPPHLLYIYQNKQSSQRDFNLIILFSFNVIFSLGWEGIKFANPPGMIIFLRNMYLGDYT